MRLIGYAIDAFGAAFPQERQEPGIRVSTAGGYGCRLHGAQVQGRRGPVLGQRSASLPWPRLRSYRLVLPAIADLNQVCAARIRLLQAMLEQSPAATSMARVPSGASFSMTCVTVRSTTPLASLAIMHRRRCPGSKPEMAAGTLLYHADISMIV